MSIFGGGGGGGGGGSTSGTQTTIAREAPGVEARKLALYDEAANLAKSPVSLPGIQVAPISALEQAGIRQAGQTGVGAGTVTGGIGAFQGAQQTAAAGPNIAQFFTKHLQTFLLTRLESKFIVLLILLSITGNVISLRIPLISIHVETFAVPFGSN